MPDSIILGLIQNTAVLLALGLLYDYFWVNDLEKRLIRKKILLGLMIGGMAVVLIASPWTLIPGIVFDTRSVLLALSGLFFGSIPTLIAIIITSLYRIFLGGGGIYMGVAVITCSGLIGIFWRKFRKKQIIEYSLAEFYLIGLVVHVTMLGCAVFLPSEKAFSVFKTIALPVMIIYPLGTMLLGGMMKNRSKRWLTQLLLSKSEEKFRSITDQISDMIFLTDEKGNLQYASKSCIDIFGYVPEEMKKKNIMDFIDNEQATLALEHFIQTLNQKIHNPHIQLNLKKKDGSFFIGEITSTLFVDNDLKGALGVIRDITSRIQSEQALLMSEKNYREIFNSTKEAIFIHDAKSGLIMDVNEPMLKMFGYQSKQEVVGKLIDDFSENKSPFTLSDAFAKFDQAMKFGYVIFEWSAKRKDGELFWVEVSLKKSEIGGDIRVLAVVRDINERKISEKIIRESEEKFSKVFNEAPLWISLSNPETGVYCDVNDSFIKASGYSREELVGKSSVEIGWFTKEERQKYAEIFREKKRIERIELKFETRYNGIRYCIVKGELIEINGKSMLLSIIEDITEQKKKTELIFRLSKCLEQTPASIIITDANGIIEYVNKTFTTITGFSADEAIGKTPRILKSDLTPQDTYIHLWHTILGGKDWMGILQNKKKNGEYYWERALISPVFDEIGKVINFIAIKEDITEQRSIQEELSEKNLIFQQFLKHSPIYIFFKDKNLRTLYLSENYENMLGIPLKDLLGKTMDDLFPSDLAKKMIEDDKRILEQDVLIQTDEELNGKYYSTVKFPIKQSGKDPILAGFTMDITERKQAEIALKYSEARLASFMEFVPAMIIIKDHESRPVYVNDQVKKRFFIEEYFGKLPHESLPFEEAEIEVAHDQDAFNSGYTVYEEDKTGLDNVKYTLLVQKFRINIPDSNPMLGVIIMDISQQKEAERELIDALDRAERSDKLKEAFLQNMSHEIRTPMNAIVGFADLLNEEDLTPENRKEFISIVTSSSRQLLSIVNDILTVSRIQTGQEIINYEYFELHRMLQNLYSIFLPNAQEKGLELILCLPSDGKQTLYADQTKINQILTNLLSNAIKFTHRGKVEFGYKQKENNFFEFYVLDTGIGISKEQQAFIFDRFAQADTSIGKNYGGTGLGLSISKSFTELMGGTIYVESRPENGSHFIFVLPLQSSENDPVLIGLLPGKMEIKAMNYTILCAEDEYFNIRLIEHWFEKNNYRLLIANNGLEAIEMCKNHPEIDLVLMDIKMPELDGLSALIEIRKFRPELPMFALTAYAMEKDRDHLLNNGFNDYISKPIRKEELLEMVSNQLNKQ